MSGIVPDYLNEPLAVSSLKTPRKLKPDGYIIIDGQERAQTLKCRHCGGHWIVLKGSGIRRGWCIKCNGPLCGKEKCMKYHVPHAIGVEAEEKHLNLEETLKLVRRREGNII
jgi:hypothetical protein